MSYSRWKIALYAVPILVGILLAVPNLLSRQQLDALPDWLPKRQVALGLDLQGGSHLLLEIDTAALIRAREEAVADRIVQGLGNVGIHGAEVTTANGDLAVTIRDGNRFDEAVTAIRNITTPVSGVISDAGAPEMQVTTSSGKIKVEPTKAAVAAWTRGALEQSLEIVRRRVDETGVVEPTIMRQGTDRVLI